MNTKTENVKTSNPSGLVCEFRLSKRMFDLGIKLSTFFYYIYFPNTGKHFIYRNKTAFKTYKYNLEKEIDCQLIPAPLSEELADLLPELHKTWWETNEKNARLKTWFCSKQDLNAIDIIVKSANRESSARAKILIHWIEKELPFNGQPEDR